MPHFVRTRFPLSTAALLSGMTVAVAYIPAHAAGPLPQNGQFVAGAGSIGTPTTSGTASSLTISQTSPRGIVNWGSFSIGNGNTVTIQNGSGATLNRVTGASASIIGGALNSTGSVYLINPQGVVIGPTGTVTTGGRFVASSLDVDNDAFMQGGALTFTSTAAAPAVVVNLGNISATGGDVFLIAQKAVANGGTISAPQGSVEMAAGQQVLLQDSTTSQQVFVQAGSQGDVINRGPISAAQINLQAADGNIYALAGTDTTLRATGTATRDGHIWLVAGGNVQTHAALDATNADGTGGTVDMQGHRFDISNSEIITGQWNLTSPVFSVDAPTAYTLSRSLSKGTNVTVNGSGVGDTGDIGIGSSISWTGNASLVFNAYRSLYVETNATLANAGGGNLTLRADSTGADNSGIVTNVGTIDWSASTGIVSALYDINGYYLPGTIRSNPNWSATPFSGLQTQVTAYQLVNSIPALQTVANNLSGNFALGRDIASNPNLPPTIAIADATGQAFTGQFDGLGHTIADIGVQTNNPDGVSTGLFGTIGTTGVVRNVGIIDVSMFNPPHNNIPIGVAILAGLNQGLVSNVYTSGMIYLDPSAGGGNAGGLVVQNDGTIQRSSSSVNVSTWGSIAGGLVAINNGTISQSFATGFVYGPHTTVGGLVGNNSGSISQSYATGAATGFTAGALVGGTLGNIYEAFSTGTASGELLYNYYTTGVIYNLVNASTSDITSGVPQAQMALASSYGPTWNFSGTGAWRIPAGAPNPILTWQTASP